MSARIKTRRPCGCRLTNEGGWKGSGIDGQSFYFSLPRAVTGYLIPYRKLKRGIPIREVRFGPVPGEGQDRDGRKESTTCGSAPVDADRLEGIARPSMQQTSE